MNEIKNLKKYDLHCHLDGSLSAAAIKKLAAETGRELPDLEQLKRQLQVSDHCQSLKEYLAKFELPLSCLITAHNFKTAVLEVLKVASRENVVYMELRFAPLLSVHDHLSCREIIESAVAGIEEGRKSYGIRSSLIICGMRHLPPADNIELVKTAREFLGAGVCAMDLAGDEMNYPVKLHSEMFQLAKKLKMPFTIHAGECGSSQSIWDAIELGATRIGHGIAARSDHQLKRYCADKKIPLEMCPSSNIQTKAVNSMADYPFLEFLEAGMHVTVNTDNRVVSNTSITKELELLKEHFHITVTDMEMLMNYAAEAAFACP